MPINLSASSARYRHIDAMRGVAALAVVYFHIAMEALSAGTARSGLESTIFLWTTSIFDLGKIAVIMFFAISGYVIPFSLLRQGHGVKRNFVIGRFFRLYPAYWLSAIAAAIVLFHLGGKELPTKTFLANLTMFQGFLHQPDMVGVYWTLQIEIIFYALCFCLYAVGWLDKPKVIVLVSAVFLMVAVLMSAVRYKTGVKLPVALPLSIVVMFFGMMWRMRDLLKARSINGIVAAYLIILVIAIPVVSLLAYSVNYGFNETWYRYTISYYTAVACFVVFSNFIRSRSPILAYLGTISYSVYLFGPIVQSATTWILPSLASGAWPAHLQIVVVLLVTIGVGSVVYHFIELPSIGLGKNIARRLLPRRQLLNAMSFEAPL